MSKRKLPPCYACGRQLWGKTHTRLKSKEDSHSRFFHKNCAKGAVDIFPELWEEVDVKDQK